MHLSVLDLIYHRAGRVRVNPAISVFRDGEWTQLRFEDIQRSALHLSNFLIESGIKSGDRIAILSESNPEFGVVFFAAIRAGAILVPLHPKLSADDLKLQVLDSAPKIMFASKSCFELASSVVTGIETIGTVIVTDEPSSSGRDKTLQGVSTHILKEGRERDLEETALTFYTAGVTGVPKGVMVTFNNLLSQAECLDRLFDVGKKDLFLSAVPMTQLTELTLGYLGVLFAGGQVCYLPDSTFKAKIKALHKQKITYMITTAPFLNSMKNLIQKRLAKSSTQKRLQFKMRFGLAKLLPRRARRRLFPLVHDLIGAQFRSFISSGAPLSRDLEYFLDTVGIDICHGYGLAETSSLTSINSQENFRMHSVGKPLPDIEVRLVGSKGIGDEGEVVTRGPHVMRGYYNRDDKTNIAIDSSGWLYTGDLGVFDEDGFLFINGRIKDLIHLMDGSKFYPQEVEQLILQSDLIKEVCLVGIRDSSSFHHQEVVAVVVPEKKNQKISGINKSVALLMQNLPALKNPSRIVISNDALPRTHFGEIQRKLVLDWLKSHEAANR
ncbi:N/A [soil metagenome]